MDRRKREAGKAEAYGTADGGKEKTAQGGRQTQKRRCVPPILCGSR